jgi:hypothetical protein
MLTVSSKEPLRREPQGGSTCVEALPAVPASAAISGGRYLNKSSVLDFSSYN